MWWFIYNTVKVKPTCLILTAKESFVYLTNPFYSLFHFITSHEFTNHGFWKVPKNYSLL